MDQNTSKTNETPIFVLIRTMDKLIYEGYANSITSTNDKGKFDVLPLHANFISLIKSYIIIHGKDGDKEFKIDNGILKNTSNKVYIFLGRDIK